MNYRQKVINLLRQLNVTPSKDRGQNFLIDPQVVACIIDFAGPAGAEEVLEIGPGIGALTSRLLGYAAKLHVVEIEEHFAEYLSQQYPDVNVINQDIRFFDYSDFANRISVFGNLPYSLSSDIVFHLLSQSSQIKRAVLMFQKEFAQRVAAGPGSKAYGVISVLVGLKADVVSGPVFGGQHFYPEAGVESQVIELQFYTEPKYDVQDEFVLGNLLRTVFATRRKKLSNTIKKLDLGWQVDYTKVLKNARIDGDLRPEQVSVEEFVRLANELCKTQPVRD